MIVPPLFDIAELGSLLMPGRLLAGRYEVVRHLANGGMGQVFEARDLELDRRVAVKTLHPQIASSPLALERFQREIRLAREIEHPNVCRIYDFGTYHSAPHGQSQQLLFLVMELLEGETLAARIERRGRIPAEEASPLAEQIARGLGAAHDQGIVHRDLKSRNIFLVPGPGGPRAVITDFGLACQITGNLDSTLTLEGDLLGTPAYMSPEQLEGGPVDATADVYALGVVIYEMLTGRLPFEGDTPISVALQHLHNLPISPRQLVPGLDPHWERIVLRCLEKRPSRRFASTRELISELGDSPRPGRRPFRAWSLVAALAILALVGWITLPPDGGAGGQVTAEPPAAAPPPRPASSAAAQAYFQGLESLEAHDFETARTRFEAALDADPESPLAQIRLAEALFAADERAEAREAARRALPLVGLLSSEERLLIQGIFHRIHGANERALEIYRELYASTPSSFEYGSNLAYLLIDSGETRDAQEVLQNLRQLTLSATAALRLDLLDAHVSGALSDLERQRRAAQRAAARAAELGQPHLEAEARLVLAGVLLAVESVAASTREAKRAGALFAEAGSETGVASALMAEGWSLFQDQELGEARERYHRALEIYRAKGHEDGAAWALGRLAAADWREGDLESSRKRYLEVIAHHQRSEEPRALMNATYNLGLVLEALGEIDEARRHFTQARDFWRDVGNRRGEALATNVLGVLAGNSGDWVEAALRYGEAVAIHEQIGDRSGVIVPLSNQAFATLRLGDVGRAEATAERVAELLEATGMARPRENYLSLQIEIALVRDRPGEAARFAAELREIDAEEGGMATLEIELARDRLEEAEALARELLAKALPEADPSKTAQARFTLARVLERRRLTGEAQALLESLGEWPGPAEPFELELERRLLEGRLTAALGPGPEARELLRDLETLAEKTGFYELELETRLSLCTLELEGDPLECLSKLEGEAADKDFHLLARRAREAQNTNPPSIRPGG